MSRTIRSSHDHVGGRVHATDRGNAAEIRLRHGLDVIGREGPLDARFAPPTLALLLYGEVQMVVPAAMLTQDFGVEADCASGRVRLLERPHGIERRRGSCHGTSAPATGRRSDRASNRDRAAPVHPSMLTGLCDGPVTDYGSTLIRSGHCSPISTAADFRGSPRSCCARRFSGRAPGCTSRTTRSKRRPGELPARRVHEVELRLPGLTHGEGVWWSRVSGDRELRPR
jgi:ribosomal protection tetracycline resistance protein